MKDVAEYVLFGGPNHVWFRASKKFLLKYLEH